MSPRASPRDPAEVQVLRAGLQHRIHIQDIAAAIGVEVDAGEIGLARRTPEWLSRCIDEGLALIAVCGEAWAGFCAVHPWDGGRFVSTSALIVRHDFRGRGVASRLKEAALDLCRRRFPQAIPFGLTTSEAIRAINRRLGFVEVPYAEISRDPEFWKGCESCPHHANLLANRGATCHCTAMRLPPGD